MEWSGELDHNPIILDIKGALRRPPSPFKCNSTWINDPRFISLVNTNWAHLNLVEGNRVLVQFMENLKRNKKSTIPWDQYKKVREDE